ncbi:DUF3348 domain-containing protein [Cupriavidus oxalaticus]|jgi:hypothetical protein|uniref:DUF3348 domain-containing protein n=1 Tax=Cupriavidus oxalaticus TaxID=96344 RepID=A0A375FJN1_9BURK|nr:DUF3348 domain-containing protein [Cupriavidus oxalaticus]QRQ84166.1 DUF3348 domain-containing protein [Cupriavidus oxalaticus]QRQ91745.1 DUF3348 domain-containing protein [Cupriavidus oxalaticus]WQD86331.1 DUF3348 domain-containing protein [Cupriavidus oxalaticus]SPC05645.1 conserved hypothetical protein [Cupriavidus oxalaticus]SPC17852.1 conserved hypothetical protein [Cupriavidus oxalaticus]
MSQEPRRTGFSGPTLVRLLARLTDADAPPPATSLSGQLSQWLGWPDAIALSAALKAGSAAVPANPRACGATAEEQECARVRGALADAIAGDNALAARRRGPGRPSALAEAMDAQVDYAIYRHRYVSQQQAMETAIGALRGRLRAALSTRAPDMARLAMVDAVMERVLGAREQSVLGSVPTLLEGHFQRLRQAEAAALAEAQAATKPAAAAPVAPGAWLAVFRKDMQSVLLAELEIRFQPVEGLLAALRGS